MHMDLLSMDSISQGNGLMTPFKPLLSLDKLCTLESAVHASMSLNGGETVIFDLATLALSTAPYDFGDY